MVKLSVQTFQPQILIYRNGNFWSIIGNIHQFIGHCLIPLDPWSIYLSIWVSGLPQNHDYTKVPIKPFQDEDNEYYTVDSRVMAQSRSFFCLEMNDGNQ